MNISRFGFLFLACASAWAQQPAQYDWGPALRRWNSQKPVFLKIPEHGEGQSAVCSVPLLEMKIPSDVDFTMKVLTVPKLENPGGEQIKPPAPVCGKSTAERTIVFPK